MPIEFEKYQGTGNDFVLIDNRRSHFSKNDTKLVEQLCDRNFGIGADGLILLEESERADFKMVYYNSDGRLSTMCGNGGRCISRFAHSLGVVEQQGRFEAVDGLHAFTIGAGEVALEMRDVQLVELHADHVFADTGSPHHVQMVKDLSLFEVVDTGRRIRHDRYGEEGANINFVEQQGESTFAVRTYERGVEDETLSCGTGVTAVALAVFAMGLTTSQKVNLLTPGGSLVVSFIPDGGAFKNIWLTGPAGRVFKGVWEL